MLSGKNKTRLPCKSIYIRADASALMGAGHVMRCLTIAKTLTEAGFQCIFIEDRIGIHWAKKLIIGSGFALQFLDKMGQEHSRNSILLLDSYQVNVTDAEIHSFQWASIVQLVDPASPILPSNMFISPNPYPDSRLKNMQVPCFEGVQYIPIRDEFILGHRRKSKVELDTLQILVSGGGSNLFNFVEASCEVLRTFDLCFEVTALTSSNLVNTWEDVRFKTCDLGNLSSLKMENYDIFLTTAGQSGWEFLATGKLVGVALGVSNQSENYRFLLEKGLAVDVGYYKDLGWHIDLDWILDFYQGNLLPLSHSMAIEIPNFGLGAKNIADKISSMLIS